jgi:hypothetical protein
MLGWFSMSATTSIEDAEWLLARAAGFDAGFAFNINLANVKKNGSGDAIFEAIKTWETARMAGAFTTGLKLQMEDINNEFHLENAGVGKWMLYPYKIERYIHEQKIRQPGEPVNSIFEFENPYENQTMMFIISYIADSNAPGAIIENILLEVNNHDTFNIPVEMVSNQHLKLDNSGNLKLFDANWNLLRTIKSTENIPVLSSGKNKIIFDAKFSEEGGAKLKIEMKTRGKAEPIQAEKSSSCSQPN